MTGVAATGATAVDGGVGQDTGLEVEMLIMADLSSGHRTKTCPVFLAFYRRPWGELEADLRRTRHFFSMFSVRIG